MLRILMLDLAGPAKWFQSGGAMGHWKVFGFLTLELGDSLLIVSALKLLFFSIVYLFYFCYSKSGGQCPLFLGHPGVVSPIWFNTVKYFFIHCIQIILRDFPSKLITAGSIKSRHGGYVFHLQGNSNARKKCLVVSISVPQLHVCLK